MARIEDIQIGAKFIIEQEIVAIDTLNKLVAWSEYKSTGENTRRWAHVSTIILFELPNRLPKAGDSVSAKGQNLTGRILATHGSQAWVEWSDKRRATCDLKNLIRVVRPA